MALKAATRSPSKFQRYTQPLVPQEASIIVIWHRANPVTMDLCPRNVCSSCRSGRCQRRMSPSSAAENKWSLCRARHVMGLPVRCGEPSPHGASLWRVLLLPTPQIPITPLLSPQTYVWRIGSYLTHSTCNGQIWCRVPWRGMMCRGVAVKYASHVYGLCGVVGGVRCGVPKALLPKGNGRGVVHPGKCEMGGP